MLTKELLGLIASQSGLNKKQAEHLLSTSNAIIRENLMAGKAIQLQGLGALEIKTRGERVFIHPGTGEKSVMPAKNQLVFRPVATLKEELKKI